MRQEASSYVEKQNCRIIIIAGWGLRKAQTEKFDKPYRQLPYETVS